jgi:hypothetical protein
MADANPRTEGSRDSASIDVASNGDLFVAFADGKAPKRQARLTVLGPDAKQKLKSVFDVSPDGTNVLEVRVVAIGDGKALVTYIEQSSALTGVVVSCKY